MSDEPKKDLGPPTHAEAREVWENMKDPSSQKCADALIAMGYDTSKSTIARWKKREWADALPNSKPLAEKGKVRGVAKVLREQLDKLPPATVAEADKMAAEGGLEGAMTGGKLTDDDYTRIEKLISELAGKNRDQLLEEQEKARIIMNTVMMKEATRRAHVMVLIPKETGSFVKDTNEAAEDTPSVAPIEAMPMRNGDDARVIEGKASEAAPPTPFQLALKKLREEELA